MTQVNGLPERVARDLKARIAPTRRPSVPGEVFLIEEEVGSKKPELFRRYTFLQNLDDPKLGFEPNDESYCRGVAWSYSLKHYLRDRLEEIPGVDSVRVGATEMLVVFAPLPARSVYDADLKTAFNDVFGKGHWKCTREERYHLQTPEKIEGEIPALAHDVAPVQLLAAVG